MKNKKTSSVLEKICSKTFKGAKKKQVFEPAMSFGALLDESIGIVLTANKEADKFSLQIGKTELFLNADSLNFVIKSIVTMGAMVAKESENVFTEKLRSSQENSNKDDSIGFVRILSSKTGTEGIEEGAELITSETDRLIAENSLKSVFFPGLKNATDENKKKMILRAANLSDKVFEKMEDDLIELKKNGTNVLEEGFLRISEAIAYNLQCIEKIKKQISSEELDLIAKKTLSNFIEISNIHGNYFKHLPQEEQKAVLKGLIGSFQEIKEVVETEQVKEKSKAEIQEETNKMLDKMLEETDSKPASFVKIEEGVMEEIVEEKPADVVEFSLPEYVEEKEEQLTVEEEVSQESFPAEESYEDEQVCLDESLEEDDFAEMSQQASFIQDDDAENMDGFELESEAIESIEGYFEDSQPIASSGTSFAEDEDEDEEEVDDEFLKRMEDVEGMLSGNYELQEEEIPTFEKIEKLKIEHGELAAKEYVSSLSQEQREALVRERLAARVAAGTASPNTPQE